MIALRMMSCTSTSILFASPFPFRLVPHGYVQITHGRQMKESGHGVCVSCMFFVYSILDPNRPSLLKITAVPEKTRNLATTPSSVELLVQATILPFPRIRPSLLPLSPTVRRLSSKQPPSRVPYFRYHILVILVSLIFLCSWKMPYMRASLVGGQPGT